MWSLLISVTTGCILIISTPTPPQLHIFSTRFFFYHFQTHYFFYFWHFFLVCYLKPRDAPFSAYRMLPVSLAKRKQPQSVIEMRCACWSLANEEECSCLQKKKIKIKNRKEPEFYFIVTFNFRDPNWNYDTKLFYACIPMMFGVKTNKAHFFGFDQEKGAKKKKLCAQRKEAKRLKKTCVESLKKIIIFFFEKATKHCCFKRLPT